MALRRKVVAKVKDMARAGIWNRAAEAGSLTIRFQFVL